jgi:hypothetical protein
MTAWNAIVAGTNHVAQQYAQAFGLSPEVWATYALGQAVTGRGFHRVVIIRPHWGSGGTHAIVELEIEHWHTRLLQDGKLKVL